ncbi:hypothetical protein [Tabrizicola sp. BL-A-41-H6]|uniref:hypothetical protein n=1 Tax=Tabrizicola sp. BL-A-41-H6 TaxID=3421107 RepID=UPI003D67F61F
MTTKTIAGVLEIGKDNRTSDRFILTGMDLTLLADAVDILSPLGASEQRALDRLRRILRPAHAPA